MSKGISALSNEYAVKYGMAEAFIINKLEYYIKDILEDDSFKVDGRTYKRMSLSTWGKVLPFLSKGQIERALANLTAQNVLTTTRINGHWSDRTVSYGFVNEPLFLGTFKPKSLIADISRTQEIDILPTRNASSCQQEMPVPASEKCSLYNNTIYNNNYIAEPPSNEVGKPAKKNAQEGKKIHPVYSEDRVPQEWIDKVHEKAGRTGLEQYAQSLFEKFKAYYINNPKRRPDINPLLAWSAAWIKIDEIPSSPKQSSSANSPITKSDILKTMEMDSSLKQKLGEDISEDDSIVNQCLTLFPHIQKWRIRGLAMDYARDCENALDIGKSGFISFIQSKQR